MRQKTVYLFYPFIIVALITLTNCKKENPPAPVPANTSTSSASASTALKSQARNYITGYLGGEPITITDNSSYFTNFSEQNGNTAAGSSNTFTIPLITGTRWSESDANGLMVTTGQVELRKEIFRIYVTPFLSNNYYDMLTPQIYSIANTTGDTNGAYIAIRDNNGVLWTSVGSQLGSYMMITARGQNLAAYANISAVIHCRLYDGNGNAKTFITTGFNANFGL